MSVDFEFYDEEPRLMTSKDWEIFYRNLYAELRKDMLEFVLSELPDEQNLQEK